MREFFDQIADYMSRELAVNGWWILEISAIIFLESFIAMYYIVKYRGEHKRLINSESSHIDCQNRLNNLKCQATFFDNTIKSMRERLHNSTEENRRIAVDQAVKLASMLKTPDVDVHATYKQIYRFLTGKA